MRIVPLPHVGHETFPVKPNTAFSAASQPSEIAEAKTEEKPPESGKKQAKKEKTPAKAKAPQATANEKIDASRLDLRVGKIVKVQKHPDADTLYLEESK